MSRFTPSSDTPGWEATLRRLCRVSTSLRAGRAVRVYEVRVPTPENLATVSDLLAKAQPTGEHPGGVVAADA